MSEFARPSLLEVLSPASAAATDGASLSESTLETTYQLHAAALALLSSPEADPSSSSSTLPLRNLALRQSRAFLRSLAAASPSGSGPRREAGAHLSTRGWSSNRAADESGPGQSSASNEERTTLPLAGGPDQSALLGPVLGLPAQSPGDARNDGMRLPAYWQAHNGFCETCGCLRLYGVTVTSLASREERRASATGKAKSRATSDDAASPHDHSRRPKKIRKGESLAAASSTSHAAEKVARPPRDCLSRPSRPLFHCRICQSDAPPLAGRMPQPPPPSTSLTPEETSAKAASKARFPSTRKRDRLEGEGDPRGKVVLGTQVSAKPASVGDSPASGAPSKTNKPTSREAKAVQLQSGIVKAVEKVASPAPSTKPQPSERSQTGTSAGGRAAQTAHADKKSSSPQSQAVSKQHIPKHDKPQLTEHPVGPRDASQPPAKHSLKPAPSSHVAAPTTQKGLATGAAKGSGKGKPDHRAALRAMLSKDKDKGKDKGAGQGAMSGHQSGAGTGAGGGGLRDFLDGLM